MVEIRRMGPQIGVEVQGVDVRTLDEAGFAPIYQAWLDCNILCVRDQELTIPEFVAYSRRFGPVVPHPSKSTRHPEYSEITMLGVDKFDADGRLRDEIYRRGAEGWHTDGVIGAFSYGGRRGRSRLLNAEDQEWTPVHHPIVRIHPETGRKSLYFDPGKI